MRECRTSKLNSGVFKPDNDVDIDWWMGFVFIFIAGALIWLLVALAVSLGFSADDVVYPGYILYFLVPFLFLKFNFECSTRAAIKCALLAPVVVVAVRLPFLILAS